MAVILFCAAHPDDETLGMGVAIAEHVAAGHDVNVLVMSRSVGSAVKDFLNGVSTSGWWGVPHDPAAEGYTPLTSGEFGQARIDECRRALDTLATGLGTITLHESGLTGGFTSTDAQNAIVAVSDVINPGGPVRLKGHTWVTQLDAHAEHIAVGSAMKALKAANPTRFGDVRYYILPQYWNDPDLNLVTESIDWPTDAGISARALNACRVYGAWAPPHSYAIGHHSVFSTMFAPLMTGSGPRCMFHT